MSGAAYGIASFVDGFFKGQGIRHANEDRKDAKARQKVLDDLMMAREQRAIEDHNWTMSERQRAREEQDYFRKVNEDAYAATEESFGATPPQAAPVAAPAPIPTSGGTGGMGAAPLPIIAPGSAPGADALRIAQDITMQQGGPAPGAPAAPAVARVVTDPRVDMPVAGNAPLVDAVAAVANGQPPVGYGEGKVDPRLAGAAGMPNAPQPPRAPQYTFADWQAMSRTERKRAGLPTSALGAQIHFSRLFGGDTPAQPEPPVDPNAAPAPSGPNYDHQWMQPGGMGADVNEAYQRTKQAAFDVGRNIIPQGLDMLTGKPLLDAARPAINAAGEYITGNPEVMPELPGFQGMADQVFGARPEPTPSSATFAPGPAAPPSAPVNQPRASAEGPGPRIANLPKDLTPTERNLAETGMEEMAKGNTPAMQATAAAAGAELGALQPQQGKPVTEAQRNRGAQAFMDRYMEVGAPMVVEAMLKRGRLEDATKFMDWMEQRSTKAAMDNWAKAAFAISVGDFDSFAENAIEAYNRLDYFPDGTTIVKDESGFTKDKDGNINGAKITYRDENTGNTFEQVFAGPDDLVRFGMTMLAPENAFEMFLEQQQQAAESAAGAQKEAVKEQADIRKLVLQEANKLVENSKGLDGRPTLTFDQASQIIMEQLGMGAPQAPQTFADPGGDAPVVYRP